MKNFMLALTLLLGTAEAAEKTEAFALKQSYELESGQSYEAAIRAMSHLYNASPRDYFLNLRLGWLNYLNGNYKNALTHYDAALAAHGSSIDALSGKLNALSAQKKWKEAEAVALSLNARLPNNYTTNLRLAHILIEQKKYKAAVRILRKVLTLYPDTVETLNVLAEAQRRDGDTEGASHTLQRSLTLSPGNEYAMGIVREMTKVKE